MQVNEAFSMRKIEGSIKASTGIMKSVNSLVRLPELTGTMTELSQELVKAGVIEEMVDDMLPVTEIEGEDEEAEEEIDKVLSEILKDKLPVSKIEEPDLPAAPVHIEEEEKDEADDLINARLESLRS
jgi:charged multivesicular body protein 3